MRFYDTCALINHYKSIFNDEEKFYISNITLKELENIKTNPNKDSEVRYRARQITKFLLDNEDRYTLIPFLRDYEEEIKEHQELQNIDDSRIIISAYHVNQETPIDFTTTDLNCRLLAKSLGLNVTFLTDDEEEEYTGFKEIILNEEKLAEFYNSLSLKQANDLYINEYFIIKDTTEKVIDQYKWTEDGFKQIPYICFDSKQFGKIKPKDVYQQIAMDSMRKNKITMIRGAAGTGKSYLSLGYLFEKLEKHEIDKIIVFCNTVATMGSAKLGYYPGTRDEKLLDSQIGNLLSSKLGDKIAVERMIEDGELVLLPMSDIRGYDTTGMKAGIYITEAQNMDIELMRLALQRIGEDSVCILDGDSDAQVDLSIYNGDNNGMRRVSKVFRNDPVYGEVTLQNIYRSRIARLAQLL